MNTKMLWKIALSILLMGVILVFLYFTFIVRWWLGMSEVIVAALTALMLVPVIWLKVKRYRGILTILVLAAYTAFIIAVFWLNPAGIVDDYHLPFFALLFIVIHLLESEKWWPWQQAREE